MEFLARVHARSRMLSESDVTTPRRTRIVTASLVIRATGGIELPLVCSPSQVAPMLGRSDHSIRDDCIAGLIPPFPSERVGRAPPDCYSPAARPDWDSLRDRPVQEGGVVTASLTTQELGPDRMDSAR